MLTPSLPALAFAMRSLRSIQRDLVELAVGYLLVLAAVWTPQPWSRALFFLGLGWVALVTLLSGEGPAALGLKLSAVKRDYWVFAASAGFALAAALISYRYNTLHVPFSSPTPRLHAGGYILWAFVQQFILQDYFLGRLLRVLPGKSSAVIAASVMFSLAHLPNPLLTVATLVWGAVACVLFLRYRDLYSLGVAHAIFGLCIAFTVPNAIHHQMRVGLGYLRYRQHVVQRSQSNQMVSTSEWVIADAKSRCSTRQARP